MGTPIDHTSCDAACLSEIGMYFFSTTDLFPWHVYRSIEKAASLKEFVDMLIIMLNIEPDTLSFYPRATQFCH